MLNVKIKNRLLLLITVSSFTVAFALLTVNCLAPEHVPFAGMISAVLILVGIFVRMGHKNSSRN